MTLLEVMKEQQELSEGHWQEVKQKSREALVSAASTSSSDLKLYVYLLPVASTRSSIERHFGCRVKVTGPYASSGVAQGKAHCWLTCSDMDEYNRLLALNNTFLEDHQIRVEPARPKRSAAPAPPIAIATVTTNTTVTANTTCSSTAISTTPTETGGDSSSMDMSQWCTPCDAEGEAMSQCTCVICQESDMDGSNAVRLLCVCKQVFHKTCITQWFQSQASCPNCRFSFVAPALLATERCFDKFFDAPVDISPNWQGAAAQSWFDVPSVADAVLINLQEAKYDERPLPVQQHAGPIIASGRSLLATAETGSGKTAAYLVPIISRLHHQRQTWSAASDRRDVKKPAAVIIAPTHELVTQIAKAAGTLAKGTCVRVSVAHGNLDSKQQRQQLNRGCDLLVASRGRALQLMQEGRVSLEDTETLCFDEADVLLQGEGMEQIACMLAQCPDSVQVLMFSATFHPDRRKQACAQLLPTNFVELHIGSVGMITKNVEQNFFLADSDDEKLQFLEHILRRKQRAAERGGTIIFVNTRARADLLCKSLVSMSVSATCMHGELVADERSEHLRLFSKGHCEVMVATAAFGRGLDLPHITHVINFDMPNTRDEYTQQCGRAGRGGALGVATTIVPSVKAKHTNACFFSELYHAAVSAL